MFGREAARFNNTKNRDQTEKSTDQEWALELGRAEQEVWQDILGTRVEVKPLPEIVTPEVRRTLDRLGFGLRYIPPLELGTVDNLRGGYFRARSAERYLKDLQLAYPNWKPFESLSDKERADPTVPRNLGKWYWELVRDGKVDFPALPGQWMGVEIVERPSDRRTPFAKLLGLDDKAEYISNISWYGLRNAIEGEKHRILGKMGLSGSPADIRLLEALEKNLLANREGWGRNNAHEWRRADTYEWTNTECRGLGEPQRLVVGGSAIGGGVDARWGNPYMGRFGVSFRATVVLGS